MWISLQGRSLFLQSSRNVSVNIVNSNNQLLTQLITDQGCPKVICGPQGDLEWPPQPQSKNAPELAHQKRQLMQIDNF
ncbi:hypothetical protein AMECASPLE_027689 [Ameca splendens]|uniref:Uncharacterized protein n=1 Tax=Ameca splendens TaxID=208324 RepID=A0ABV0XIE7_9TELE